MLNYIGLIKNVGLSYYGEGRDGIMFRVGLSEMQDIF